MKSNVEMLIKKFKTYINKTPKTKAEIADMVGISLFTLKQLLKDGKPSRITTIKLEKFLEDNK